MNPARPQLGDVSLLKTIHNEKTGRQDWAGGAKVSHVTGSLGIGGGAEVSHVTGSLGIGGGAEVSHVTGPAGMGGGWRGWAPSLPSFS